MFKFLMVCVLCLVSTITNAEVVAEFIAPESYSRTIMDRTDTVRYPSPLPLLKHVVEEDEDGGLAVSIYFADAEGNNTDSIPVVLIETFEGTTRPQLLGLLLQLENLMNNGGDTAKALRSIADLYTRPDEVGVEIQAMRRIVNSIEDQMWKIEK